MLVYLILYPIKKTVVEPVTASFNAVIAKAQSIIQTKSEIFQEGLIKPLNNVDSVNFNIYHDESLDIEVVTTGEIFEIPS